MMIHFSYFMCFPKYISFPSFHHYFVVIRKMTHKYSPMYCLYNSIAQNVPFKEILKIFQRVNLWIEPRVESWNDLLCSGLFTEAVVRMCSEKKMFLEISQNSQKSTCARDYFLIKLQA